MENESIEIRYKRWVRVFSYIWFPLGLAVIVYALQGFIPVDYSNPISESVHVIVYFIFALGAIVTIGGIPYVHSTKIRISSNGVSKSGLLPVELGYDDIKQVSVKRGRVEVNGERFWKMIQFGDLFDDYEPALRILGSQLQSHDHIEIKGEDEFLDKYA